MRTIKYILVNESYLEDAVLAIRNSRVSDFRHSHIISAAGLSRPELISVLLALCQDPGHIRVGT